MNCQFCRGKLIFNAEELDGERLLRNLEEINDRLEMLEINVRLKMMKNKLTTMLIDDWQFTFIIKNS